MRVTVTGGAGFIGSSVVDRLLAAGHAVSVLDDFSTGSPANLAGARAAHPDTLTVARADVTDPGIVPILAGTAPEVVLHLAAQIDVRRSVADPAADALVNVVGTLRVLEGARAAGARKLVFASSGGAVHGSLLPGEPPAAEDAPRRPESPYGVSKLVVQDYFALYRDQYGLEVTTLAMANAYGPRQDPAGEGGVVAIFGSRLLRGERCVIYGDGGQSRDFVFVDDVADAFARALTAGDGETFNIGTGIETTIAGLYRVMAASAGVNDEARCEAARPGEARRSCLDPGKAGRLLGWQPRTPLADGIVRVLDHWRRAAAG